MTASDRLSHHLQAEIVMRVSHDMPFDQFYGRFFDFDTGYITGMSPASTVEVVRLLHLPCQTLLLAQREEHRAMGVACDGDHVTVSGPPYDTCFHLAALSGLLSRTRRVSKPEDVLQRTPNVTHPKSAEWNECVVDKVSLVAVKKENLFSQHGRLIDMDVRKKIRDEHSSFLECLLHPFFICHLQVVVPCNVAQPVVFVEPVHLPEDVSVGPYDICQIPVFIQFVSVTELDVREVAGVIIVQSAREDKVVVYEIIGPIPDSPMEIAENHDFRFRCQIEYLLVVLECLIQSWLDPQETHVLFPPCILSLKNDESAGEDRFVTPKRTGMSKISLLAAMVELSIMNKIMNKMGGVKNFLNDMHESSEEKRNCSAERASLIVSRCTTSKTQRMR